MLKIIRYYKKLRKIRELIKCQKYDSSPLTRICLKKIYISILRYGMLSCPIIIKMPHIPLASKYEKDQDYRKKYDKMFGKISKYNIELSKVSEEHFKHILKLCELSIMREYLNSKSTEYVLYEI